MRLDTASGRSGFADYKQLRNGGSVPSPGLGDLETQSDLAVVRSEHRLLVRNDRLDLDDQHQPRRRVPCEEINRSSLPADPERDLCRNLPPRAT